MLSKDVPVEPETFEDLTPDLDDGSDLSGPVVFTRDIFPFVATVPGPTEFPFTDLRGKLPTHPHKHYSSRSLSAIDQVVIHHTGGSARASAKNISDWIIRPEPHGRDFPGFPYHIYVLPDGEIQYCQDMGLRTFHVGNWNTRAVGIALAGNFTGDGAPPVEQWNAAARVCAWVLYHFQLDLTRLVGHKWVPGYQRADGTHTTICPGGSIRGGPQWWEGFRTKVAGYLRTFQTPAPTPPHTIPVPLAEIERMLYLSDKATWWQEEAVRAIETGQHEIAREILLSRSVPMTHELRELLRSKGAGT